MPSTVKVTVPVGVPAPGAMAVTVAVKVTASATTEGFNEDVSAVVVLALFTVTPTLPELTPRLASPL